MHARVVGAAMIIAAAIGVEASPAISDGLPTRTPDPYGYVPPGVSLLYDWTGIYIGGSLGAEATRMEWSAPGVDRADRFYNSGLAGGAFLGLQKQWSWIVLGAEVEYLWAGQSATSTPGTFPNTTFNGTSRDLILVTGKLGWAWENILAYFKGGWASGDVTYRTNVAGMGALIITAGGRENGWTAGAGIEYALWPHVIIGVEYDYVAPLTGSAPTQVVSTFGAVGTSVSAHTDIQSVTARLSFKFGGGS